MKKYFPKIFAAFVIITWIFTCIMGNSFAAFNASEENTAGITMLKSIMLAKLPG